MNRLKGQKGFSLIEMLVVMSIIGILSTVVILNFRQGGRETSLRQVAQRVASDIREAQTMTLGAKRYAGEARCGYGISYKDPTTYIVYVGPSSKDVDCDLVTSRNYGAAEDSIVETVKVLDVKIEFVKPFPDIFFQPPNPTTYIDNKDLIQSNTPADIELTTATGDTKKILVYPSGLVEVQ